MDGIGNPVQFINQSTVQSAVFDYDPYGAVQIDKPTGTAAVQNPYRFVGGTYDRTTGYVKYGQRWYDPTTGRFTTQDQYSFLANPGRGNRYAYAGDDPINNIDPTGKWSLDVDLSFCRGICGGAGVSINEDGSVHPCIEAGVGTGKGLDPTLELSNGSAEEGLTGSVSCSAGGIGYSRATDGSEGISPGGVEPECGASAKYTF